MQERKYARIFLVACSLPVLYLAVQIFRPFLFPVSLAVVLATLTYPLFERISVRVKGHRGWAAFLTSLLITVIILVPVVILLGLLSAELAQVYQQFQKKLQEGYFQNILDLRRYPYLSVWLERLKPFVDLEQTEVSQSFTSAIEKASLLFLRQSATILSSLFQLAVDFFVLIVTLFFLFRDGGRLGEEIKSWSPLSERYENLIVRKFREVTTATVMGSLLTALAQGAAGGLVFWIVGISNPVLWGALTALFSLVPVVGTAVVWLPWTLYFLATGATVRAIVLVLLEVFLVGMIDNVLRPVLIEGRAKMHTLVVFFSIMGGIAYFGISGMVFGPIVVALGLTFIELYKIEFRKELSKTK